MITKVPKWRISLSFCTLGLKKASKERVFKGVREGTSGLPRPIPLGPNGVYSVFFAISSIEHRRALSSSKGYSINVAIAVALTTACAHLSRWRHLHWDSRQSPLYYSWISWIRWIPRLGICSMTTMQLVVYLSDKQCNKGPFMKMPRKIINKRGDSRSSNKNEK